jgi:hypothetical protein
MEILYRFGEATSSMRMKGLKPDETKLAAEKRGEKTAEGKLVWSTIPHLSA